MNNNSKRVFEALDWASSILEASNRESHAAKIFMQYVLNVDYTHLVMNMREALTVVQQQQFEELVQQHIAGHPLSLIHI